MANIKKSFNFRNGVQVDNDNFIVNANGLVGIGSTVPTELLDVGGNVRIRGTLIANSISGTIIKTSTDAIASFDRINVGITTITSGIITASSGIVTYYGDGSKLQGLPTSQWIDVNPAINLYTSIYSAGNVGIATTNPIYTFQVGGRYDILSFGNGVGISSDGDIRATRDVTIGRNLNVTGISTIGSNLIVSGITTAYSFSGFGTNLTGINASNISNGTLDSTRLPSNINSPSGIITASSFYGSFVGIASTARGLTSDANIDINSIVSDYSDLGITTSSSLNVTNSLGVGTNNPNSDIHVRKIGSNVKLQVTSDSNTAQIILGKDITLTSNNTILQFNDTSGSTHPQSGENSFDIINYAPGNFNSFIRPQTTPNLKFNWINHSTNDILMSLTSGGNLGLGKTNPSLTFEVVGASTITSNSFVGGDFSVSGSITGGSLNITGSSTLKSTIINGSVGIFANSPNYTVQIGNTLNTSGTSGTGVGISSSGNVVASGIITASKFVGIGSNLTLLNPENISSGTIGNISINASTGIITASKFVGIGSNLTLLNASNISSGTIGNISINASTGIITASKFVGIGSNLTLLNASNISSGTIDSIDISGSVDINISGIITASKFVGIGTRITNILPINIDSGVITNVNLYSPSGISTVGLISASNTVQTPRISVGNDNCVITTGIGTINAVAGVTTTIQSSYISNPDFISDDFFIALTNNGNYQSQNISILGNAVVAVSTEYGILHNSNKIASFTVDIISSPNPRIRLNITPQSGISGLTTYRYVKKSLRGLE